MNRVGGTLGGAVLWFVWLRRGRIVSITSELRRYDRMNNPTSKFVAAVRNAVLTISLTTVLSIAVLVAAKRKKQ